MTDLEKFFKGDIRELSRAISTVENLDDGYRELLGRLYEKAGGTLRIGVTGPPGAGKSTLVNGLVHEFLSRDKRIGIIAVDPSSPFTGGALLGDRVRMNEFPIGGQVFFRSMATRGATGGLSSGTDNVSVVLDAFGFDVILIETVGVGQVELDIIDTCDTVMVVLVPESGDAVQTMKAGLLEVADILVVNKSDRPGAEGMTADLRQMLKLRKKKEGLWPIPVIPTEATTRKGLEKLFAAAEEHIAFVRKSGWLENHRHRQIKRKVLNVLYHRIQKEFLDRVSDDTTFAEAVERIYRGETNPYTVGDELFHKLTGGR